MLTPLVKNYILRDEKPYSLIDRTPIVIVGAYFFFFS